MSDAPHSIEDLPLFLTVDEVAAILRKGRTATYAAIERGQIPAMKVGRTLRVRRDALLSLGNAPNDAAAAPTFERS